MIKRIIKRDRLMLSTALAILFHLIGLVGILFFHNTMIIDATALNLMLMVALICLTHNSKEKSLYLFLVVSFIVGILSEMVGVNTGLLYGNYQYGEKLGPKLIGVPLIIGMNWFMVMYCIGSSTNMLYDKINSSNDTSKKKWRRWGTVIDGALVAVFFDWLMEPVAIKLGWWTWSGNGEIPLFNYVSWFIISMILLAIFNTLKWQQKNNPFAINLLLIQSMFFLILRTFL